MKSTLNLVLVDFSCYLSLEIERLWYYNVLLEEVMNFGKVTEWRMGKVQYVVGRPRGRPQANAKGANCSKQSCMEMASRAEAEAYQETVM